MAQRIPSKGDHLSSLTPVANIELSLMHLAKRLGKKFRADNNGLSIEVSGSKIEYSIVKEGTSRIIGSQQIPSDKKLTLLAEIGRKMLTHVLEL